MRTAPSLTFLGAAGTVTGSRFLLSLGGEHYLFESGLFQGPRELRQLNWDPFLPDHRLEGVVLTHAHLDHSGYLPRLLADRGSLHVHTSDATSALLGLLLPDAGYLQEEEARYVNKKGYSRHHPALPLFTAQQAVEALKSLVPMRMGRPKTMGDGLSITMHPAGHILGSAEVECEVRGTDGRTMTVVFSGDLGRYGQEFMRAPSQVEEADYVIMESTYGDRDHPPLTREEALEGVVRRTYDRAGVLLIPSFAVGRAQEVLYYLRKLEDAGRIPKQPVYIDSPMAESATGAYLGYSDDENMGVGLVAPDGDSPLRCNQTRFVQTVDESKALNETPGPFIVISASGMCEGGRVLHHLKRRLPDPANAVFLVGFQPQGTRGRMLKDGAAALTIHRETVPVHAQVVAADTFSSHADRGDLLRWLSGFRRPPKAVFLVHGEPAATTGLKTLIRERLGWNVHVPSRGDSITLHNRGWD